MLAVLDCQLQEEAPGHYATPDSVLDQAITLEKVSYELIDTFDSRDTLCESDSILMIARKVSQCKSQANKSKRFAKM